MQSIHALKPGTYRGEDGHAWTFTARELADIADSYDPKLSEAPLVIGHPTTDDPAWGWVAKAAADADGLHVTPAQVAPELSEAVGAGRYKKISVALYPPGNAANPKPGHWYLRHVGFLGAKPPAVKGLKAIQFADTTDFVTVEFSEPKPQTPDDSLWSRFAARIVAAFSEASPPVAVPPAAATSPATPGASSSSPSPESAMPDPVTDAKLAEALATIDKLNAKIAADEAAAKAAAAKSRRERIAALAESAVKAGKLLPAERALIVELGSALEPGVTVQLAEGADKQPVDAALAAFLAALPQRVALGEAAGKPLNADAAVAQFAAPPGYTVSADRAELHAKALAYVASHPNTDYETAARVIANAA